MQSEDEDATSGKAAALVNTLDREFPHHEILWKAMKTVMTLRVYEISMIHRKPLTGLFSMFRGKK